MITTMTTNSKLANSAETCEVLRISRPTLTRWVQSGRIKVAVEGAGIRGPRFFYRSEVARIKRQLSNKAAA